MYALRAYIKKLGFPVDIDSYQKKMSDLSMNAANGETYTLDDAEYLIIPVSTFKELFNTKPASRRVKNTSSEKTDK